MTGKPTIDASSPGAMTDALERILVSQRFTASPTMRNFLVYVVEETVAGREADLKAYSIAIDALGKPESFDAQNDPSVRVLAGRVRTALIEYYAAEGSEDPVRITIPTGGYRPFFELTNVEAPVAGVTPVDQQRTVISTQSPSVKSRSSVIAFSLAVLVLSLGLFAYLLWANDPEQVAANTISVSFDQGTNPVADQSEKLSRLLRELRSAVARNESVTVINRQASGTEQENDSVTDFAVSAAVQENENGGVFSVELVNGRTKGIVWARSFPLSQGDMLKNPHPVIKLVARELQTQIFGASVKALEGRDPQKLTARQLFVLSTWVPGPSKATLAWEKERVSLARLALEKAPDFGPAHSVLADKLAFLAGVDGPSNTPEALQEARMHAERAIELSASAAMPMFNAAQWQWHTGQLRAATRSYKRVLDLDPNFGLAGFFANVAPYTCVPAPDETLQEAIAFDRSLGADNPIRWVTLTWLGWLHLNRDEYELALEAEQRAAQIFQIPYTTMRHAAVLNVLDRTDEAVELIRSQRRNWPNIDPEHFSEVTMPRLCKEHPGEEKMLEFYRALTEATKARLAQ